METLEAYLNGLAGPGATPGGGSAAMFVAATGVALVAMVARICAANPKFTEQRQAAERIAATADGLRLAFAQARQRDEHAFERVVQAQRLPKASEAEKVHRREVLEDALREAAAVPLEMAALTVRALALVDETRMFQNRGLISDLGCAAEFLYAAFNACAYNVRINHLYMQRAEQVGTQEQELTRLETAAMQLHAGIREAVQRTLAS